MRHIMSLSVKCVILSHFVRHIMSLSVMCVILRKAEALKKCDKWHITYVVRHIMTTSVMQASDNQPGQCIEITKCESLGRKQSIQKDK